MPVYLDNSATTRVCDEAAQKMLDVMQNHFGNPSSLHMMGLEAELILTAARKSVAAALGVSSTEIFFTSGGTEANNLAVLGAARALRRRGNRIVTTAIEHPSVQNAVTVLEKEGFEVVRLVPDADGAVRESDLLEAVTKETVLVSMMLVNNETGAIQPVAAAKRAVTRVDSPALVHCDCVQGFLKIPFRPDRLGVDLATVSSHKIHGPKGAGALYIRSGARVLPLLFGGGQEKGLRPGTEPLPAIAGFGEAAHVACALFDDTARSTRALRRLCIDRLSAMPAAVLNPDTLGGRSPQEDERLFAPHILNVSIPGLRSETMLHFLESKGIFVSSGSACAKGATSPVLTAMGLASARVDSAIRVSFCRDNTPEDAAALIDALAYGAANLFRK
jgi:cysteine desulfurase